MDDENREWSDEERNEHLSMIKNKLKNKKIKDKLEDHISKIQEIFECPIKISLMFDDEDYSNDINDREEFESSKKLYLDEFMEFLESEDKSLVVHIDPLYLKDGINEISNILLTSIDEKLIIIPEID